MAAIAILPGCTGMQRALDELASRIEQEGRLDAVGVQDGVEFLAREQAHRRTCLQLADYRIARDIVRAHLDEAFVVTACREARVRMRERGERPKDGGGQAVRLLLPGGTTMCFHTRYLRPSRRGSVGRPRGAGRRGAGGAGVFPVLERLGIRDGVTPLARSQIAQRVVLASSLVEAQEQLVEDGMKVHTSVLTRVAVTTGEEALAQRDRAMAAARSGPVPSASTFAGKRLRVSLDGGRVRVRHTRRGRGIRPGRNKRRPFELRWHEPRIITVDVLDEDGEMDRKWRPIYEVTMGQADDVFALLTGVLRQIGAGLAAEVLFVSDGAKWIWERLARLREEAGIPADRFYIVLDYYHATEYISGALDLCKNMKAAERATLHHELCERLLEPQGPAAVIAHLRSLARGRRSKELLKKVAYLERHLDHLRYAELRAARRPIGSGIVESAVRRLINLRFKSASMCWHPDHIAPLLYLRAVLKAGRWSEFMEARLRGRHWLQPGGPVAEVTPEDTRMAA